MRFEQFDALFIGASPIFTTVIYSDMRAATVDLEPRVGEVRINLSFFRGYIFLSWTPGRSPRSTHLLSASRHRPWAESRESSKSKNGLGAGLCGGI
jgi:hypothetical protein